MKIYYISIMNRLKKLIIPTLLLPLLLATIGYFYEIKASPVDVYYTEVEIMLGDYNDLYWNNADNAKNLLESNNFLGEVFKDFSVEEIEEVKAGLSINIKNPSLLQLTYTSATDEQAKEVLPQITTTFLEKDLNNVLEREEIIQSSIQNITDEDVSEEVIVEKERFLYELRSESMKLKEAYVFEPIQQFDQKTAPGLSPVQRAVMGFLIGIIIIFGWVTVPVLFKEQ